MAAHFSALPAASYRDCHDDPKECRMQHKPYVGVPHNAVHCPLRPQTDCHKHPKQRRVRGGVLSTTVEVPNPFKYP